MASHVVIIGSNARKLTVRTTPSKHLSDILLEACSKFGLDADQHGLKSVNPVQIFGILLRLTRSRHNNKAVDLSRTVRLSGLSPGAKLDLVQASRSPSVVTIALQLPTSDSDPSTPGSAQPRLTDKVPSNTPIWQLLRRFESGATGSTSGTSGTYNFTQRASLAMDSGSSATGSGRLCYNMPVVNIMGRELASFTDLQKTLAQLGLNAVSYTHLTLPTIYSV